MNNSSTYNGNGRVLRALSIFENKTLVFFSQDSKCEVERSDSGVGRDVLHTSNSTEKVSACYVTHFNSVLCGSGTSFYKFCNTVACCYKSATYFVEVIERRYI